MLTAKKDNSISMTLFMLPELNALLHASAKRSGRAKTTEALFRLEDHLRLFDSLATPGQRFPVDGNNNG